jgi:hypothetical protein
MSQSVRNVIFPSDKKRKSFRSFFEPVLCDTAPVKAVGAGSEVRTRELGSNQKEKAPWRRQKQIQHL